MFKFEIALLFVGLIISVITLYKSLKKTDKTKVSKVLGFEIKNIGGLLAGLYVIVFAIGVIVYIERLDKEIETSTKQKFIFEDVSKVKQGVINLDSLIKIQLDSLNEILNSSKGNASALSELDSLTKLSIKNRKKSLAQFSKTNDELQKALNLNIQLSERNRQISEHLLIDNYGGNSYAIIKPVEPWGIDSWDKDEFELEILNVGETSLKNVLIEIEDLTAKRICDSLADNNPELRNLYERADFTKKCYNNVLFNYTIGDLYLSKGVKKLQSNVPWRQNGGLGAVKGITFHKMKLFKNQKNVSLKITVSSNNGQFIQFIDILDATRSNQTYLCTAIFRGASFKKLYDFKRPNSYPKKALEKFGEHFPRRAIDPFKDYLYVIEE